MDQEKIKTMLETIFSHTNCTLSKCEFENEGTMLWCKIETPDSRFMIGRDGETLRSLNHVVRRMVEKEVGENTDTSLFVDINGYQKKHFDNLKATAHMMAERARYFKSNIEVDPMPAYERRIIHMFLENMKDIKTESKGEGANRRVVIQYIDTNQGV